MDLVPLANKDVPPPDAKKVLYKCLVYQEHFFQSPVGQTGIEPATICTLTIFNHPTPRLFFSFSCAFSSFSRRSHFTRFDWSNNAYVKI